MAQTILNRIAEGDKTAAAECLNTYSGLVWSLTRRMCPNKEDAEDAVQDIFIDIWKNAGRFDENQASETTFIAMIARRRLIDRLRKNQRQPNVDSFEDILAEPADYSNQQMQISVEANEAAEAMKILRPEQRQILHLSIVQGFSHQEISDALQMPLGTVKTHARRGLIEVREFLGLDNSENTKEVKA